MEALCYFIAVGIPETLVLLLILLFGFWVELLITM